MQDDMKETIAVELSEAERIILQLIRQMEDGQLRIVVKNGVPSSAEEIHITTLLDE